MAADLPLAILLCPVCGPAFAERTSYAGHPGRTRTYCSTDCARTAAARLRRQHRAAAALQQRHAERADLEARGLLVPLPGMPGIQR